MPSGFYLGGFGQGVGRGLSSIGEMLSQKAKFDEQKKTMDLQRKMLEIQIQQKTREESQALERDRILGDIATSMSQPVGQSIFQGVEEEGAGLVGPPAAPIRQKTLPEILQDPAIVGRMIQAQGKEAIPQLLKQVPGIAKPNAYTNPNGYASPEEAASASGMPVNRMKMGLNGRWFPEGSEPVNWGARLAAAASQQHLKDNPGDVAGAQRAGTNAANLYQYMQGGYRAMGQQESELSRAPGEPLPPTPGTSAPQAPTPPAPSTLSQQGTTPAPPPLQAPQVPQPSTQPYGTPAGGPRKSVLETRKEQERLQQALPAGVEDVLAKGGTLGKLVEQIRLTAKPEFLGKPIAGETEFEARRRFGRFGGQYVGMGEPSGQETIFRQNLQSAKNLIVYLQTGKQINESEASRLNAAMPQPYDNYENFLKGLTRFEQEMQTIMNEHKAAAKAGRGELQPSGGFQGELPPPPAGWRR